MSILENIKALLVSLPEKDIQLAQKFTEQRQFESLYEIVVSDIYLTKKNESKARPNTMYSQVDLEKLYELKVILEEYMSYLDVPGDNDYYD